MDPVSLGIAAVGLGLQIFGGFGQAEKSQEAAKVSQDIAAQEQNVNKAKLKQMELEGRRTQLENVRNGQRARAFALNAATNQGAQFGSGLAGGEAQITDKTLFNNLGVNQALGIGREISGYNNQISSDKGQLAQIGADSAQYAGLASLGGAALKAGPIIGNFSQGFGGNSNIAVGDYSMPRVGSGFA